MSEHIHFWIELGRTATGDVHERCVGCRIERKAPLPEKDRQTTWGELKAQMADVADDTPLMVLYDSQAGCSVKIERITPQEPVDWAQPNTVYLDISRGQ